MKIFTEIMMVLGSLLFWSTILPLIFVMKTGALIVEKIDGHADTGSATVVAH